MANILATPRFWKTKAVLLKPEVTYGVDPVPTGAANWIEARNVALTAFEAETAERNIEQPFFGVGGKIIASVWSKLSFEVALQGSGAAGTAPKWAPIALACGYAETIVAVTSAAYNVVSSAFGSATAYLNIDGVLYKFIGARGELKVKINAKGIPVLSVELSSVYAAPVTSAMFAPITKTGWIEELGVNNVNTGKLTLNAVDFAFSNLEFSTGNQISKIDLPGPQVEVAIVNRKPSASVTILAPALAVFDPYALARAGTNVNLTNTHGTAAGSKVKTDMKVVITNVAEDKIDEMLAYKLTLEPTPVSGNDELAITCL